MSAYNKATIKNQRNLYLFIPMHRWFQSEIYATVGNGAGNIPGGREAD